LPDKSTPAAFVLDRGVGADDLAGALELCMAELGVAFVEGAPVDSTGTDDTLTAGGEVGVIGAVLEAGSTVEAAAAAGADGEVTGMAGRTVVLSPTAVPPVVQPAASTARIAVPATSATARNRRTAG
jgi:hypothetical protein